MSIQHVQLRSPTARRVGPAANAGLASDMGALLWCNCDEKRVNSSIYWQNHAARAAARIAGVVRRCRTLSSHVALRLAEAVPTLDSANCRGCPGRFRQGSIFYRFRPQNLLTLSLIILLSLLQIRVLILTIYVNLLRYYVVKVQDLSFEVISYR